MRQSHHKILPILRLPLGLSQIVCVQLRYVAPVFFRYKRYEHLSKVDEGKEETKWNHYNEEDALVATKFADVR